jgi:hypothetical protein
MLHGESDSPKSRQAQAPGFEEFAPTVDSRGPAPVTEEAESAFVRTRGLSGRLLTDGTPTPTHAVEEEDASSPGTARVEPTDLLGGLRFGKSTPQLGREVLAQQEVEKQREEVVEVASMTYLSGLLTRAASSQILPKK